jgi:LPPG:FO 2-phospho-L-lactate transferase
VIIALAGGVGGAKLALGLSLVTPPDRLSIVVNTGDDFSHLGLNISPDIDTVIYTLAGLANPDTGWGLADETWSFMTMLETLGGETWFKLGDRDLATHLERTRLLVSGTLLSAITSQFCRRLGVRHPVMPMTNDSVRTVIESQGKLVPFQDYFVRQRCEPVVQGIRYEGAREAQLVPQLSAALSSSALEGIVICPSNPYLSIGPMIAMPALRQALERRRRPVVAISPVIAGAAIKGPVAKIMSELGIAPNCLSIARHYQGLIDVLMIDQADSTSKDAIRVLGIEPVVSDIVMRTTDDRRRLAQECCALLLR